MIKGNCYGQVLLLQKAMKDIEWWKTKVQFFIRKIDFSSQKCILTASEGCPK